MATKPPIQASAGSSPVKPPNVGIGPRGSANNGYLSLATDGQKVFGPNQTDRGDRRGGSANLAQHPSPVMPPNAHRFDAGMSKMPQPPSAVSVPKGAVPVDLFKAGGSAATAASVADMAKPRGK